MIKKAFIYKTCSDNEKYDFINEQFYLKRYEIRETDEALEAWGDTDSEILFKLKENKKQEASQKAYDFIENGALFEFEKGKHIEATDGNISKLGLALMELLLNQDTTSEIDWCTYEDEAVKLNAEQLTKIVQGLKGVQTEVWTVKFPYFLEKIEKAENADEINNIKIDYNITDESEVDDEI